MNDLLLLSPEIIITTVAFAIFTLDIVWKDEAKSGRLIPWIAFGGALLALLATINAWSAASGEFGVTTDAASSVSMVAVDEMAFFFKLLAILTVILVSLSAVEYVDKYTPFKGEFYALTLLAGLSLMLLSSATNLIMIFLALEFLSITSYILTGYLRQDARSTEAALKYFLYGAVASGVMLYGFSLLYGVTGHVDLGQIAQVFASVEIDTNLGNLPETTEFLRGSVIFSVATIVLILAGFGFKIALVPFHQWSPDAYEGAPTPITAFLSVGPKVAGIAVLIRVLVVALPEFSFNWTAILALIAVLTMTVGNLVALWQTNMKRMLAYSSIAQAGYMIVGLAAWTAQPTSPYAFMGGVDAMMFFLLAYVFTNLGVFAVAIILENKTGTANISDYAGLVRRSPFLSIALLVFFLSLIGIPPTGGFMGKFFVFGAAVNEGLYTLTLIGVLNSAVSVYYYFGVTRQVFFTSGPDESPIRTSKTLNTVVALTLIMTLLLAFSAQPFIQLASDSAQNILASAF